VFLLVDTGAEGDPIDFEWKTPGMNRDNGYDQWTEGVLTDEVTGEIFVVYQNRKPYTQYWADDSIVCAHLDPDTGTLTDRWVYHYPINNSYRYLYFPSNRQYLVHDGHFYFLYYTDEDGSVHLRIDNMSEDRKRWSIGESQLIILGIKDGSLLFIKADWQRDSWVLYTVSLEDFKTTEKDIFTYFFDTAGQRFLYRNGAIHSVLWRQTKHGSYNYSHHLMIDTYYVGLELRVGPTQVDLDPLDWLGTIHFDVDSEGFFHILYEDNEGNSMGLHKVSSAGEVAASTDIGHLLDDLDVNFSASWINVQVNQTDHVYLLGRFMPNHFSNGILCSLVFSSDYEMEVSRQILVSGSIHQRFFFSHISMNGTGAIFTIWYDQLDDLNRVYFSYQIPLTPDLELSPSGFKFREVGGALEPIWIQALVSNVGRAISRSYWTEISYSLNGVEPFTRVLDLRIHEPLDINDTHTLERYIALPQGSLMLRVEIHNVTPYENNRGNNILDGWFFVSNNNPPTILVDLPNDGSTGFDSIVVSGETNDIDIGGEVETIITGLPSLTISFNGEGPWNRTVDLEDVPSGVYTLSFRAYDGQHYSEIIYRRVRIARAVDHLRLASLYPQGDVTLIEGEEQVFFFNATDPLMNDLDYRWNVDMGELSERSNYFIFKAHEVGDLRLGVNVTNGFTFLTHAWNITVIELIMPRIERIHPIDPNVTMRKRVERGFSIEVYNPHAVPCSVTWTLDGDVQSGDDIQARSLQFPISGRHTLSAWLFTTSSHEVICWNISIFNEAPTFISWSPVNTTVVIEDELMMVFEVEAIDGDGDYLGYSWAIDDRALPEQYGNSAQISLPADNSTTYRVQVYVSDDEVTSILDWHVRPEPSEPPSGPIEDPTPWRTSSFGILTLVVGICAIILSYLYVRSREV